MRLILTVCLKMFGTKATMPYLKTSCFNLQMK